MCVCVLMEYTDHSIDATKAKGLPFYFSILHESFARKTNAHKTQTSYKMYGFLFSLSLFSRILFKKQTQWMAKCVWENRAKHAFIVFHGLFSADYSKKNNIKRRTQTHIYINI